MMAPSATLTVFVLLALCEGHAYKWTAPFQGGQLVYSCVGNTATFPFQYELEKGEEIRFIRWTFNGYFSFQSVATYTPSPDNFNPSDGYGNRVTQVGNAGIALHNVTERDKGNYSVEITGRDGTGNYFTFYGMATGQFTDRLLAEGQEVKVIQLPEAVKVEDTGKWSVALACGRFTHLGVPPFPVHWMTPTGDVIQESSNYKHGHYILVLPNPVKGGNYSCKIPRLYADDACVGAESQSKTQATVVVDEIHARLSLLEANQEEVRYNLTAAVQRLTEELNSRSAQDAQTMEHLNLTLAKARKALFAELDVRAKGSAYIRWGSTTCPNDTDTIYSGYLGGGLYSEHGSSSSLLCLPTNPVYDDLKRTSCGPSTIYGGEYEVCPDPRHNMDVVCALCRSPRSASLMIPATNVCPFGWTREYTGHVMSNFGGYNSATDYVCVDDSLQYRAGGQGEQKGVRLYYTISKCGALPCPPYQENKILSCVVCSL